MMGGFCVTYVSMLSPFFIFSQSKSMISFSFRGTILTASIDSLGAINAFADAICAQPSTWVTPQVLLNFKITGLQTTVFHFGAL